MARPKGKLFALLAIFAAIGIVTATGAFTSVQADRSMNVTVDDDTTAILGLEPYNGPNGYNPTDGGSTTSSEGYADLENGVLRINLGGYNGGTPAGQSLNYNATTQFNNVFNISNNGQSDITYYITRNGEAANADNTVVFYNGTGYAGAQNVTAQVGSPEPLNQGHTDSISIEVELSGIDSSDVGSGNQIITGITIHADSA